MANKVRVDIDGKETVSTAAAKASGSLTTLKDSTANLKKESQDLVSPVMNLKSAFSAIAGPVGIAVVAVKSLSAAIGKAMELGAAGAKLQQTEEAFRNLSAAAGQSAQEILASLKEASKGTVAEMDLIASASKAALYKLPLQDLDKLMAIARASSRATGESVQKMFDDIVVGIARGSPMILDNLGITIKLEDAYKKYAAQLGKTADGLTAAEKSQALLQATIESGMATVNSMGESMAELSDSEQIDSARAAFVNLKNEISEGLSPAVSTVNEGLQDMFNWLRDILNTSPRLRDLSRSMPGVDVKRLEEQHGKISPGGTIESWAERKARELGVSTSGASTRAPAAPGRTRTYGGGTFWYDVNASLREDVINPMINAFEAVTPEVKFFGNAISELTAFSSDWEVAGAKVVEVFGEAGLELTAFSSDWEVAGAKVVETFAAVGLELTAFSSDFEVAGARVVEALGVAGANAGRSGGLRTADPEAKKAIFETHSFAEALTMAVQSIASLQLIMDPWVTMLTAAVEIIGPLIDSALAPLVGILVVLGQLIGNMLAPVIQMLAPIIELVAKAFVWLYNNVLLPVGNVIIALFIWISLFVKGIANAVIGLLNLLGAKIAYLDMTVPEKADWALQPIDIDALTAAGSSAISSAGTSYTSGSTTTVEHQPDIYVTINIQGSVYGAGGPSQVGKEVGRALEEFAGIGGRIHILGALT